MTSTNFPVVFIFALSPGGESEKQHRESRIRHREPERHRREPIRQRALGPTAQSSAAVPTFVLRDRIANASEAMAYPDDSIVAKARADGEPMAITSLHLGSCGGAMGEPCVAMGKLW